MSHLPLTLGFGLLLAAGGLLLVTRQPPPALPQAARLCPELALRAAPGRLITQAQSGAAGLLGCAKLDAPPGPR